MKINKQMLFNFVSVAVLLCLWESVGRWVLPNNYFLPPFSVVLKTMIHELVHGELLLQCGYSYLLASVGILVSCVIAIVVFSLCATNKYVDSFINLLCDILNPIPSVAVIPLAMFAFGLGDNVLILLICHSVLWPMLKNMVSGYHSMNPVYMDFFRNARFKRSAFFFHVVLPSVMRDILVGMKIAWGRAFRTLIAVEMVFGTTGDTGGLGFYIYKARANAQTEELYAGIVLIALLGIIVENLLFRLLEQHTVNKWGVSRK